MSPSRLDGAQSHPFRCVDQLQLEPEFRVLRAENGGAKGQLLGAMATLGEARLLQPKQPLRSARKGGGLARAVASPEGAWARERHARVALQAENGGLQARCCALARLCEPTATRPLLARRRPPRRLAWLGGQLGNPSCG
jgi:hypothetical protein